MASAKTRPGPMQDFAACVSHAEGVEATVDYLVPGSRINRRYVAPGAELNTGRYAPHTVFIRNGRPVQGTLGLDTQGFVLAKQPSLVTNFRDKTEVDAVYSAEVERIVKALTGADWWRCSDTFSEPPERRVPRFSPPQAKCTSICRQIEPFGWPRPFMKNRLLATPALADSSPAVCGVHFRSPLRTGPWLSATERAWAMMRVSRMSWCGWQSCRTRTISPHTARTRINCRPLRYSISALSIGGGISPI